MTVTLTGPGASFPGERYRKSKGRPRGGTKKFSFKIVAPGPYTFVAKSRGFSARGTYVVPAPPTPMHGPFPCV